MDELEAATSSPRAIPEKQLPLAKQYVTFKVGKLFFGVDVAEVQEIIRTQPMTPVPLAPEIVRGLVNLRGQIISAIDMRALLKLGKFPEDSTPMNVVVRTEGEVVCFLVDGIGDVIDVDHSTFESTPETVSAHISRILQGVFKLEKQLLLIVHSSKCLNTIAS